MKPVQRVLGEIIDEGANQSDQLPQSLPETAVLVQRRFRHRIAGLEKILLAFLYGTNVRLQWVADRLVQCSTVFMTVGMAQMASAKDMFSSGMARPTTDLRMASSAYLKAR